MSGQQCWTSQHFCFFQAINLLPANTQIREIRVFLESVLEEKAQRKRCNQVLKSLLQAEFLRVSPAEFIYMPPHVNYIKISAVTSNVATDETDGWVKSKKPIKKLVTLDLLELIIVLWHEIRPLSSFYKKMRYFLIPTEK